MSFYYSFFPPLGLKERFQNQDASSTGAILIMLLLAILIHVLLVQFLWNTVLVSIFPVRPLKSMAYALGLIVLVALLFP